MKGMKRKVLFFVLVILLGGLLTGCNIVITAPDCCPSQIECSLTVVADSSEVYGEIVVNGQRTGKYILPGQSIIIYGVLCNQIATISIVDNCGYWSHEENIYIIPGSNNYVVFSYWGPYGVYKEQQKEQNDYQGQNDCHCHCMSMMSTKD